MIIIMISINFIIIIVLPQSMQVARFMGQPHQSQQSSLLSSSSILMMLIMMIMISNRLQSALRRRDAKLRRKLRNQEEVKQRKMIFG